jgi:hypothetical protein
VDRYGVPTDLFDVQESAYVLVSARIERLHHDEPVIVPPPETTALHVNV